MPRSRIVQEIDQELNEAAFDEMFEHVEEDMDNMDLIGMFWLRQDMFLRLRIEGMVERQESDNLLFLDDLDLDALAREGIHLNCWWTAQ